MYRRTVVDLLAGTTRHQRQRRQRERYFLKNSGRLRQHMKHFDRVN